MRLLVLCALIFAGCTTPRQPETSDAIAEQKQRALADRDKQKERDNQTLRLAVRQLYIRDHPELSAEIRKAILKEQIKIGMSGWQVVAAYSLWEHTTDPSFATYRDLGALALWTLMDRRQTTAGQTQQDQWVLKRHKDTRYVYFENGTLTAWKD